MEIVLGFALALFVPVSFLGIVRKFDFYQTGQFNTIFLSLVLGGIAFTPAALTNTLLRHFNLFSPETIERYIAPIHEELFKGLFLVYLVRSHKFTYSVDGALYGFAVGIGFAVIENFSYIIDKPEVAFLNTLQRIFTTNLVHAFSSAAIGIALGIFYLGKSKLKWLIPLTGALIAIGQHMLYNNIIHINDIGDINIHSAYTFAPGIPGILFIGFVMQRGVKQARTWIKEELGLTDRVTQNEVAAVDQLSKSGRFLYPVVERFGDEKAKQVEKLLFLQARIGIKRKSFNSIQNNDALRSALEVEIAELHSDMEKVRREIGTYPMLFVRGLFTEEMISVWDQMQAKIQERSVANNGQKGGGVWSSLDERVKSLSEEDERVK